MLFRDFLPEGLRPATPDEMIAERLSFALRSIAAGRVHYADAATARITAQRLMESSSQQFRLRRLGSVL